MRGAQGDALVVSFLDEQEQLILLDFDFIFGLGRVVERCLKNGNIFFLVVTHERSQGKKQSNGVGGCVNF